MIFAVIGTAEVRGESSTLLGMTVILQVGSGERCSQIGHLVSSAKKRRKELDRREESLLSDTK